MGSCCECLAHEAPGCSLESVAGRPTGPEIHEPAGGRRTDLSYAGKSRTGGPERKGSEGKLSIAISRRLEGGPGLCSVVPPTRSDGCRDPAHHRLATPYHSWLPVLECA